MPRGKAVSFRSLAETFVGEGATEKARIERLCLSLLISKNL